MCAYHQPDRIWSGYKETYLFELFVPNEKEYNFNTKKTNHPKENH